MEAKTYCGVAEKDATFNKEEWRNGDGEVVQLLFDDTPSDVDKVVCLEKKEGDYCRRFTGKMLIRRDGVMVSVRWNKKVIENREFTP